MTAPLDSVELLTLNEVAERLGVHYMTAYRYLRTGRLVGMKLGTEWRVRAADLLAFEAGAAASVPSPEANGSASGPTTDGSPTRRASRRRIDWAGRAVERLIGGDEVGTWSVIGSAMAAGMSAEDVYLDLLTPALRSIGDRWELGEITVADEHVASAITLRLIGRLGPQFSRRGRKRGTVVTAGPAGETHSLPLALFADVLRGRGFRVLDLGGDVPADSLASTVADTANLLAVCFCSTTSDNEASLRAAVDAVREVTDATVLAGGRAIADPDQARSLGADGGGITTPEALDLLARLPHRVAPPAI